MSQIHGLPPLPQCFNGFIQIQRTVSESSQGDVKEGTCHTLTVPDQNKNCINVNENKTAGSYETDDCAVAAGNSPNFAQTPFIKLNNALQRLKLEMQGLRKLDVSLLYQLWTLHEAIQEYKAVMTDQFSDVGSEYSYSGLSSRAQSITSIDEYDDEYSMHEYNMQSDPSIISSLQGSTTSLIQQIEELKVRAESEF